MWQSGSGRRNGNSLNNRTTTTAPFFLLIVLLIVGMFIGAHHRQARRRGKTSPVIAASHLISYPFQLAISNMRHAGLSWNFFGDTQRLQQENAKLREEKTALEINNQQLEVQLSRLQSVAKQVQMLSSEQKKSIHAPVIGWLSNDAEMITLGRGNRDGIANDMIVRSGSQLIGRVAEAGPLTATVLLITDASSQVGVNVYRKPKTPTTSATPAPKATPKPDVKTSKPGAKPATNATPAPSAFAAEQAIVPITTNGLVPVGRGILVGGGRSEMGVSNPFTLKWVDNTQDIQAGDVVFTSGTGHIFPKEIPVGVVISGSIKSDPTASRKTAQVQPNEPIPGDLNYVFVLPK
jgi:cell shape-determining protein MreC